MQEAVALHAAAIGGLILCRSRNCPKTENCKAPIPNAKELVVKQPRIRALVPTSANVFPSLVCANVRSASTGYNVACPIHRATPPLINAFRNDGDDDETTASLLVVPVVADASANKQVFVIHAINIAIRRIKS